MVNVNLFTSTTNHRSLTSQYNFCMHKWPKLAFYTSQSLWQERRPTGLPTVKSSERTVVDALINRVHVESAQATASAAPRPSTRHKPLQIVL